MAAEAERGSSGGGRGAGRIWAYLVSAVLLAAVAMPLAGWPGDDYPISNYPMFAGRRTDSTVSLPHAIGVKADGTREVLAPSAFGTDEVMQAFETLRQALRQGGGAPEALCGELAERAGGGAIVAVEIVTDTYDGVAYFSGDTAPRATSVHAACPVGAP